MIAEKQKQLFDELRRINPDIIDDGVPDETSYLSAGCRLMYVLKEANGGSGWSLSVNQLLVQSNQLKDKSLEEYTASVKELNGQLQAQSRDLFKLKRLELSLTVLQKEYQRIAEENKTLHASLIQQDFDKRRLNDLQYQIKQLNEQISRAETIQRRQSEVILSAGSKALRLEKLLQDKETELKRVGADISRANKERDDALVQKDVAEAACQRTLAELDKTNQQLRAAFTDGAKWESENAQLRLQVENLIHATRTFYPHYM